MLRVPVKPELLRWARERAGRDDADFGARFKKLPQWEAGTEQPTLKQLEDFAKATHVPVGFFFLPAPPEEKLPIPDMRTVKNRTIAQPSPDLLDTIHLCQQRQAWYRDYTRSMGQAPLPFVGSVKRGAPVVQTAERMRGVLGFDLAEQCRCSTKEAALSRFAEQTEEAGVLVMVSGVVGGNPHRPLEVEEFRGFALSDPLAPVVFINGADTKAARMFTLAHELAHIWLGEDALSDASPAQGAAGKAEDWCNQVAAELLVPLAALQPLLAESLPLPEMATKLARRFKVSTLVALRRIFDAGRIDWPTFLKIFQEERARLIDIPKAVGGSFYRNLPVRVSKRFARALIGSTLEGHTLYRDAFRMLGVKKESTFREVGRMMGYSI